jgi:probable rRNA maturation factor
MTRAGGAGVPAGPAVDIIVTSLHWSAQRGARGIVRRSIATAAAMVPSAAGEVAIVLTDDPGIRALNRQWRGKDEPTNVLSFPGPRRGQPSAAGGQGEKGAPRLLGDIVIAYETTAREAKAEHKLFGHHLAHLVVHGFLHLAGYDHEADDQAAAMELLEIAVLARLKVRNPYIAPPAKG